MTSLYLAFSLSLSFVASAWAAEPAKLQGSWQAASAERNGAPATDVVGHRLVFAEDRFQITREGKLLYGGPYAADPSAQPARITFRQDEGSTVRGKWKGIHRFEAGRLEIVENADDMSKPAPTQFVTTSGSGYVLLRFEPR
jgi:uncharacterized protein (TIGR03067 family)